jgi:uncharacterized membrane-anchored protein YhcB (DUF1043 family)
MTPEELSLFEALVEENAGLKASVQELTIEVAMMRKQHETQMRELWHHFNNTLDMVADIVRPLVQAE